MPVFAKGGYEVIRLLIILMGKVGIGIAPFSVANSTCPGFAHLDWVSRTCVSITSEQLMRIASIVIGIITACSTLPAMADIIEFTAAADHTLIDASGNGQANSFESNFPLQLRAGEAYSVGTYRSFIEFDISVLGPTTSVTSAVLRLESASAQVGQVDLHGYLGDGAIQLSDYGAVGTSNRLGSISGAGFVGEAFNFDVTTYIQGLVSNDDEFVGFMVRSPDLELTISDRMVFYSTEFLPSDTHPPTIPILTLETTSIPEPSGLALILTLAIVCGRIRRR